MSRSDVTVHLTGNADQAVVALEQARDRLAYEEGAADERARIAWWLRAGVAGPAGINLTDPQALDLLHLAEVIEGGSAFRDAPPLRRDLDLTGRAG